MVSIKELYYDARPTKSQDLHCKTSKTDIPLQEDQKNLILCNLYKKLCIKFLSIKELYYDARPTTSQHATMYKNFIIPYLYEAQHVSGDTPPIIRSLKLHYQPLVFHT